MNILEVDDIFVTILKKLDIKSISSLLIVNTFSNNKITKYYENNEISFNDMPLFRPCKNISKYLTHYRSFISGTNFPDKPLWLFNNKKDCQFVQTNDKYIKLENIRFERPKFFNYFTTYKFQKFEKAFIHWKRLNDKQKYLIWCAIKDVHPEIKLEKSLISSDMATLLSEIYWHYSYSFVRYYLEIYNIDTCDLINSKCISETEISRELQYYRGNHLLQGYNIADDKKIYLTNYFNSCGFEENKRHREDNFRLLLSNIINVNESYINDINRLNKFVNLKASLDVLELRISELKKILDDIDDFDIIKTHGLTTTNVNYLDHMSINYNNPNYEDLTKGLNNCIQQ